MQDLKSFNPEQTLDVSEGIFGLPFTRETARLVLLPVPWDVTVSYGGGSALGPELIRAASGQVDLFDLFAQQSWRNGIYMDKTSQQILDKAQKLRTQAERVIAQLESGAELTSELSEVQEQINAASGELNTWLYQESLNLLKQGKFVGVVGGDHSTPYGHIRAVSEQHQSDFGILHIDAHLDLRKSYQGFTHSHASIMYNVMQSNFAPQKLVQVGIRDFCHSEYEYATANSDQITVFFDEKIKADLFAGATWQSICDAIVKSLPQKVYVSFDIDGLDPQFCPSTGTPVPGGLSFEQAVYLLQALVLSGRQIIGFDLNEVSGGQNPEAAEWDGNVGARMLYKLCNLLFVSQGLLQK